MSAPGRIGVLGAGVMGAGIAQLGCLAGAETLLCDSSTEALARAEERIGRDLERGAERGRWSAERAVAARSLLRPVSSAAELEGAELVIEAVPEDLEIKATALAALPGDPVIATNTSALSVTAIAARLPRPERVVGMHFFNPPPLMPLVELVAGAKTEPAALELARRTALAMERTPIEVRDAIGFVVNRGARPFYGEALRLLDEGVADPAQIDRICRLGAGFRMGPFELMDLVGTDTNLAVAETFAARSLGEPRWQPSQIQRRLVAAGRLGRKSGHGWFEYGEGRTAPADPAPPAGAGGGGRPLAILGNGAEAEALRERAAAHGFAVTAELEIAPAPLTLVAGPCSPPPPDRPLAFGLATASLAVRGQPAAVGFHLLPPATEATVAELTRLPGSDPAAAAELERTVADLGLHAEWVDDAPGLVLGRIVPQLVNEACFAVGEGVASPADVDRGMTLGLNHPLGPVAWGGRIGWDSVLGRVDALWAERHDQRYRAAPLLRRAAALGIGVEEIRDPERPHPAWN